MVAQKNEKSKKVLNAMIAVKTLYARGVRVVSAPWTRNEHAAATFCAPYKRHGRY